MPVTKASTAQVPSPQQLLVPAVRAARTAAADGEVPVGAALYSAAGEMLAVAGNRTLADTDPSAHAEVCCLREAARAVGNHRLAGCTLAVTLEPCAMCAGAIMHARLAKLYYGAADPKTGACGSVVDLFANQQLNHHTQVTGGICADECAALLRDFFAGRR